MGAFENYFNPFPKFPLRLLWWIDNLAWYHKLGFIANPLGDYLDKRLWDGIDPNSELVWEEPVDDRT